MTCDERRDLWLLLAAGALDADEQRALLQHVDGGCPRCAGARSEAEAVLAHLPLALAPVAPPAGLRERLVRRATGAPQPAERGPERGRPSLGAAPERARSRRWLAAAAVLALAAAVAGVAWRQAALESRGLRDEIARLWTMLEEARGIVAAREAEIRSLQSRIDDQSHLLASYRSPDTSIFSLSGTDAAPAAAGRLFWEKGTGRWELHATGLEPPGPEKTYQLWFVTGDGRKVSAGTFDVRPGDEVATLDGLAPVELAEVAAAAVTDEPAGGSPQPTGAMRLLGQVRES